MIELGRFLNDDEIAKEVLSLGLQNLVGNGDKGPLIDFNALLKKLQARRQMVPVTEYIPQSVEPKDPTEPALTPSAPQKVQPLTEYERLPQDLTVSTETEHEDGLEDGSDERNELGQILDDLEHGHEEATLPRVTAEDVAYNMDEIEVEVSDSEVDEEYSSSESSSDED